MHTILHFIDKSISFSSHNGQPQKTLKNFILLYWPLITLQKFAFKSWYSL